MTIAIAKPNLKFLLRKYSKRSLKVQYKLPICQNFEYLTKDDDPKP